MTDWAYELDDGTTGTVAADDLTSASQAVATLAVGRTVLVVCKIESPAPPVIHSPNGTPFAIVVDDEGVVTATPVDSA